MHTLTLYLYIQKELVVHYQLNTLGVSFPGMDTKLVYPYLDVLEAQHRTKYKSLIPDSTKSSKQDKEHWVEVLRDFIAKSPDELTVHVCMLN